MRYRVKPIVCAAALASLATHAALAQEEAAPAANMTPAEQAFAETMTGATLRGNFTVTGDETPKLRPETYNLAEVRKLAGNLWLIQTRIRYGDKDVTLPITLPVEFAGDTAVIIVKNVGFPGLGTYSARVLVNDNKYAGYWQGADHGGHLFGEIEKADGEVGGRRSEVRDESGGEG